MNKICNLIITKQVNKLLLEYLNSLLFMRSSFTFNVETNIHTITMNLKPNHVLKNVYVYPLYSRYFFFSFGQIYELNGSVLPIAEERIYFHIESNLT